MAGLNPLFGITSSLASTLLHPRASTTPAQDSPTMAEQYAILIVERTSSMLSIIASSFVLISFVLSSRLRRRSFNRLLFLATWGNLFANVATFIGHDGIDAGVDSGVCKFQGMLIQWFMPADSLWTFCMAISVFLTFHTTKVQVDMMKLEKWYFMVCYGVSALPALTYLILDLSKGTQFYGDATLWCWISQEHDVLRIATFYAPVWLIIVITMSLYAITGRAIYRSQARNRHMRKALKEMNTSSSTTCNASRPETTMLEDKAVQVHKRTEIQQTSEVIKEQNIPPTSQALAISTPDDNRLSAFDDGDKSRRSKSFISSSVTTIVTSTSDPTLLKTNADEARPSSAPRHVPILVPAFGNGMSKPLSIPLDHLPPSSRSAATTAQFSSSFSTTSSTRRKNRTSTRSHAMTYARVAFALYIIMLIVWVPSTVNRAYQLANADDGSDSMNIPLDIVAACVLPLQGLFNAIIFVFVGRRDIANGLRSAWRKHVVKQKTVTGFSQRLAGSEIETDEEDEDEDEPVEVEEILPVQMDEELADWPLRNPSTTTPKRFQSLRIPSPTLRISGLPS